MVYMKEIGVQKVPQIIINTLCFLAVAISILILFLYENSAVFKEGFFCDDKSIAYPERKETINNAHLVAGSVSFSFLAIIMCEMIAFFELWRRRRVDNKEEEDARPGGQEFKDEGDGKPGVYPKPWKVLLARIVMQMLLLIYGFMLIVFVTEVIKVNMGRLRPNFLAVCQLVPGSYNCSRGFVTDYTCGQTDSGKLADARKSFLSGHASISFFHMVFIMFYIQPRLPIRFWSVLKPLLQTLAFVMAAYVSITRITDHKHHYSDVAFGALLGAVAGALMAIKMGYVVPFRQRPFSKSMLHRYYTYSGSVWHADSDNPSPP